MEITGYSAELEAYSRSDVSLIAPSSLIQQTANLTPTTKLAVRRQLVRTVKTLPTLIVWYNTKCPVCNAGIDWQRNRLVRAARAGAMEFRDINLEPDALRHFGADVNDVRRRLHAVDADGRLYVGADCAIAIWLRTPGDAWLGRLAGLPGIRHVARAGYDMFANLLFAWNRRKGHW